jgi:cytochrome c-type biogenesis protein CcmF
MWVALLLTAWTATVSYAGGATRRADLVRSGERGIYATLVLIVLASVGLWTALLRSDFSLRFVWQFTSQALPSVYKFTAFWGGQAGSLLFWALVLSVYSAIAVWTNRQRNRQLMPYVTGTLAAILLFFLALLCLGANPYERLAFTPPDGSGLNPQLQNPGMAIHPPNLYLGYVGAAIPFAFAIAALITRRFDPDWLRTVRRWALLGWFFNSVGIVLGMWWAYVELGWGGYWSWDPVENASFLPWLTNTAFLHSIMVQEKRGMLRKWNVTLVVSTFLLTILGTFITRSGLIQSVHSFAQSPVGSWFAGFLIFAIAVTAYLVTTRLKDLRATSELESMVSREAAFLYNNVLFVGIAFSVLWGTFLPIITEAVRDKKVNVGPPFYNAVNVPLGLLLLLLTGIGPLIAWRKASKENLSRQFTIPMIVGVVSGVVLLALGLREMSTLIACVLAAFVTGTIVQEFAKGVRARVRMYEENYLAAFFRLISRNRRRYGGYIVHAGIVIVFVAFAALPFKIEKDVDLAPGRPVELRDPWGHTWKFMSQGVSTFDRASKERGGTFIDAVALDVSRDGVRQGVITSERRTYIDNQGKPLFEPTTEVGIMTTLRQDVYVVLQAINPATEKATLRITFEPLVVWVWIGGFLLAIGGLIVMWPQAERRRVQGGYAAVLEPRRVEEPVAAGV